MTRGFCKSSDFKINAKGGFPMLHAPLSRAQSLLAAGGMCAVSLLFLLFIASPVQAALGMAGLLLTELGLLALALAGAKLLGEPLRTVFPLAPAPAAADGRGGRALARRLYAGSNGGGRHAAAAAPAHRRSQHRHHRPDLHRTALAALPDRRSLPRHL